MTIFLFRYISTLPHPLSACTLILLPHSFYQFMSSSIHHICPQIFVSFCAIFPTPESCILFWYECKGTDDSNRSEYGPPSSAAHGKCICGERFNKDDMKLARRRSENRMQRNMRAENEVRSYFYGYFMDISKNSHLHCRLCNPQTLSRSHRLEYWIHALARIGERKREIYICVCLIYICVNDFSEDS